jgi:hypothetical protein
MRTCHRHYPGRFDGACSLVPLRRRRPSLCNSQVGSCDCSFEACSAFTHVMACTLAGSPCDPLHRRLRQLCCLCCRFDCYRVERTSSRAGVAPAEVQRLFTAHCYGSKHSQPETSARLFLPFVSALKLITARVRTRCQLLLAVHWSCHRDFRLSRESTHRWDFRRRPHQ